MKEFNKLLTEDILTKITTNRKAGIKYPCYVLCEQVCECKDIQNDCDRCPLYTWERFDAYMLSIDLSDSLFTNVIY